jgi:flagellar biosynthesis protein FliR
MKHVNSVRVAPAVVIAMITLPFVPGVSDRQINMILGGVAIVSIIGAAAGMVWQAITEHKEDRESGGQQ